MKKIISIVLALVMILSLCACGTVNDTEVAVLWSGDTAVALVPNSLINAVDRAMYIENIAYSHYAASGDQETQTEQAKQALDNGCAALMVELVDPESAKDIIKLAKEKDVPVVFFNCDVPENVVSSYDKCAAVVSDDEALPTEYGKVIGEYAAKEIKNLDRNGDGVIVCYADGELTELIDEANKALKDADCEEIEIAEARSLAAALKKYNDAKENMIELVITDSDESALEALESLQKIGYNSDRLKTHCIPVFTVGADADASAFTDTSAMTEEELSQLIYNAMNVVDAGQIKATAMEDYDGLAVKSCEILGNFLKGEAVENVYEAIPYAVYGME